MVRVGYGVFALGVIALMASYLGWAHPFGDSLAVFRIPLAIGLLAAAVVLPVSRRWRIAGASFAVLSLLWIGAFYLPTPFHDDQTVIYQRNLWFNNAEIDALAADIRASGAEIVTLQEVSIHNRALLDLLTDDYPTQAFCPFTDWSGMAVLSTFPADGDALCSQGRGMVAQRLKGPDGPLWAVSLHLYWPWPHEQRGQLDKLLPMLEQMDAPIVLGGDFNMVPWSSVMRRVQRATGSRRIGGSGPTLIVRHVPLLIDHILAPGGGRIKRLGSVGGDHFGLLATVSLK